MSSNDMVPAKRGSGAGWGFFALFLLAVIGACVLLPALAVMIGGIFKLVFGLIGVVIGILAALFTGVVAIGAVIIGLAVAALPVILVIAVLIGIGILIGRSQHG
jgi:hypothetical protein